MPYNHLILCHPHLLLPSIFSRIRVFSIESVLHIRWPKYWSFSLSISPSNAYSGIISFRMDWLEFLCSPRDSQESSPTSQFRGIIALVLSLFYCPAVTSIPDHWRYIALTICTFVSKVVSLLFNTLSRFVIAFLPRSKHLLISWLKSPSEVILEPKKIKSVTLFFVLCFHSFPIYLPWSDGTRCHDLSFLNVEP